jgi:hypothetical protein
VKRGGESAGVDGVHSFGAQEAVAVLEKQTSGRGAALGAMFEAMKSRKEMAAVQGAHRQQLAALKEQQQAELKAQQEEVSRCPPMCSHTFCQQTRSTMICLCFAVFFLRGVQHGCMASV